MILLTAFVLIYILNKKYLIFILYFDLTPDELYKQREINDLYFVFIINVEDHNAF
jgi:hypothetical protein